MPLFRVEDKIVLFTHIPKTGGSAIIKAVKQSGGFAVAFQTTTMRPDIACETQHWHAAMLNKAFPASFITLSFTVHRNPYDRFVSEFGMRCRMIETPRHLVSTFDSWANCVLDAYERYPFSFDNHLRPQHEFLSPGQKVFRYANGLQHINTWLAEHDIGLPEIPRHRPEGNAVAVIPPTLLRSRTLDRFKSVYASDFDKLGYDITDTRGIEVRG